MPVKTTCRVRHASTGPVLTPEQLRQVLDRLTELTIGVRDIASRVDRLEANVDVRGLAVAA